VRRYDAEMAWRTLVIGRSSKRCSSSVSCARLANGSPSPTVVLINDVPLDEPYVTEHQPWQVGEAQLGPHEFYVIGDNRGMLADLHDFGRAARSRIAGRVFH
jgi:hypothetical protein